MPNIIPEIDDLIDAGKDLGMHVTRDDAVVYHKCLGKIFAAYELVDKFPDNIPEDLSIFIYTALACAHT